MEKKGVKVDNIVPKLVVAAIDFDGTITGKNAYPEIGDVRNCMVSLIKEVRSNGVRVILWTARAGKDLKKVVGHLEDRYLLGFDAVNENVPELQGFFSGDVGPKVFAHIYYDDMHYNFKHDVVGLRDKLIEMFKKNNPDIGWKDSFICDCATCPVNCKNI